jgi:hypothetical protein
VGRRLAFVDTWSESAVDQPLQDTGSCVHYTLEVVAGNNTEPLRVCLAYTDPPGRGLQNDVNLAVDHLGPTLDVTTTWIGNAQRPHGLRETDSDNNIEVVRIEGPTPGKYRVRLLAANLLSAPQPFALVVTGPLASDALA